MLSECLANDENECGEIDIFLALLISPVINKYEYNDLKDRFILRINTQDRYYDKCCLPCRLLQKVFSKNNKYKEVIINMLDETEFLIKDEKFVKLKHIKELSFTNKEVILTSTNGVTSEIYTEVYEKGKITGKEVLSSVLISDLSLDHKESLYNLLNKEIYSYSELKKISDKMLEYKGLTKLSGSKLCTNFYNYEYKGLNRWKSTI